MENLDLAAFQPDLNPQIYKEIFMAAARDNFPNIRAKIIFRDNFAFIPSRGFAARDFKHRQIRARSRQICRDLFVLAIKRFKSCPKRRARHRQSRYQQNHGDQYRRNQRDITILICVAVFHFGKK